MKTFEVYSLYDATHRGRVLVASMQADRFSVQGDYIRFFKKTFLSLEQIGEVRTGTEFAVLDREFSLDIYPVPAPTVNPDIATPEEEAAWLSPAEILGDPKPRRRRRKNSGSVLGLD